LEGNRVRISERPIGMRHRLVFVALLALAATACGVASAEKAVPTAAGPSLAAPVDLEPSPAPTPDLRDTAADTPQRAAEPILQPVPVPVPAPSPKPVRGQPTPPPDRDLPAPSQPPVLPSDPLPDSVAQEAVGDLAARLGIDRSSIEVLDARKVTWRDGSVGCPQPGLAYTQALVPGSLVMLRVGDTSYAYHAADTSSAFYCPTPQAPLEGTA